jgi:hypothetical protein
VYAYDLVGRSARVRGEWFRGGVKGDGANADWDASGVWCQAGVVESRKRGKLDDWDLWKVGGGGSSRQGGGKGGIK